MNAVHHLGPGSALPLALELLDREAFGTGWGALDEAEHLWFVPSTAFARWRVQATLGEGELLRIAVRSDQRGQGLGRHILAHCQQELQRMGLDTLHLEVRVSNTPAQALYQTLGWRTVGRRPHYYRDGEDALLFSLELKGS